MRNIFVTARTVPALAGAVTLAALLSAPAATQEHCGGEYVVKPGDTLTAIAGRCDSTVEGLVRANARLSDPDVLLIGWRLTIPEALGHDAPGPEDGGSADEQAAGEDAEAPPPADGEADLLRLEGRVAEGPECPVLRTPDGEIYSLVGEIEFPPGAHVEVTGRPVAISFCMRGTTVEVASMREISKPAGE